MGIHCIDFVTIGNLLSLSSFTSPEKCGDGHLARPTMQSEETYRL